MKRSSLCVLTLLAVSALLPLVSFIPPASAQTQYITLSRGVINLGLTTTVTVTGPAAGDYTVVVVAPDGSTVQLPYSFASAGQAVGANYGNATLGFKTVVTQVGTYNVYLEKSGQTVSTSSFYATDKLNVWIDFVDGGLCNYIAGADRGMKIFPRFYVTYASTGAPLNKSTSVVVTFTLPDGSKLNATYHRPTVEAPVSYGFYIGKFQPNWNYSAVGPWSLMAAISDGLGNTATYNYIGPAFELGTSQLLTAVQLTDAKTSQAVGGLYDGQSVNIQATVTYPTNAEPVPGFVAPLDRSIRGGSVTALVGWGFYNSTTGAFGGGANAGGLVAKVPMTYTGSNGTWTGTFNVSNLPSLAVGASYHVVITSSDGASPPNTGMATVNVPPATFAPGASTPTTVTQTVTGAQTTVTATTTAEGAEPAPAGGLTVTTALLTAIGTLIVGLVVGVIVRRTG